nr:uncharacterized protein LOC116147103 isoform X1 [Camelus dromedarius]XP_031321545.1 uncharacterized protein LOC116147103 isoform X1 [Camelus dromedarius]
MKSARPPRFRKTSARTEETRLQSPPRRTPAPLPRTCSPTRRPRGGRARRGPDASVRGRGTEGPPGDTEKEETRHAYGGRRRGGSRRPARRAPGTGPALRGSRVPGAGQLPRKEPVSERARGWWPDWAASPGSGSEVCGPEPQPPRAGGEGLGFPRPGSADPGPEEAAPGKGAPGEGSPREAPHCARCGVESAPGRRCALCGVTRSAQGPGSGPGGDSGRTPSSAVRVRVVLRVPGEGCALPGGETEPVRSHPLPRVQDAPIPPQSRRSRAPPPRE